MSSRSYCVSAMLKNLRDKGIKYTHKHRKDEDIIHFDDTTVLVKRYYAYFYVGDKEVRLPHDMWLN